MIATNSVELRSEIIKAMHYSTNGIDFAIASFI